MKKIVQRTKRFEKAYIKLNKKIQHLFLQKLEIFLENENATALSTHRLKGKRSIEFSFSVTADIRAIYTKEIRDNKTILIFTFIDIGGHNKVY